MSAPKCERCGMELKYHGETCTFGCGEAKHSFAAPSCSAAVEPLLPYDQWRALGPEKAAEYLARRRGYSAERQGKLWAIIEAFWNEPPNS